MIRVFSLLMVLIFVPLNGWAAEWVEGKHYTEIDFPVYAGKKSGKEVAEYFYYGCPHCHRLEPYLKLWLKRKPSDVAFYSVPATFGNGRWDWSAQLFYTAKALGVLDKMHDKIFYEIHEGSGLRSVNDMAKLFKTAGISKKKFEQTFSGFSVKSQVEYARDISSETGITGVPSIIVNGKYLTSVSDAGGNAQLFRLVDWLLKNTNPE